MRCDMLAYCLFIIVTAGLLLVRVHSDTSSLGFVSIDCGLSDPPYVDERTDISYVSDDGYIETGEKKDISSEYKTKASYRTCLSLRSFPSGGRNCYTVPTTARGRKYLVRAWFMHGNYDGGGESLASRPVKFDLYIGLDFWYEVTVSDAARTYTRETITVAVASSLSVCLLDTGNGTPFISSLELRPMSSDMYPDAMANQSLGLFTRYNMGESNFLRYPDDPYDRFWWAPSPAVYSSQWVNISTNDTSMMNYYPDDHIRVPVAVLRTAVTTTATSVPLNIPQISNSLGRLPPSTDATYFHFLHFANFEQKPRQFDIYYGNTKWEYRNEPVQLNPIHNGNTPSYFPSGAHSLSSISLVATNASVLPPMLNAIEIYYSIPHDVITTTPDDECD